MTNTTTVTELSGIKMAAIIGVNSPKAAIVVPVMLYKREIRILNLTILTLVLLNLMKFPRVSKRPESRMPSQAGEKW